MSPNFLIISCYLSHHPAINEYTVSYGYAGLNAVMFSFQCHEKYLAASLRHKSVKDQERAYRELGMAHKNLGNLQQALVRKLLHQSSDHFVNSQEDFWKPYYFVRRFGHFP